MALLEPLWGFRPALEALCGNPNNELTTLDVRNTPALYWLFCHNNYFPDESAIIGFDRNITTAFTFKPQNTPPSGMSLLPPIRTIDALPHEEN